MRLYRRRHNLSCIKSGISYEYHEIARLLNISKGTVRNWVKGGLPAMQEKRPPLIYGAELKAFLKARQARSRCQCQPEEFYCFTCRQPRRAWENAVDVFAMNEKKLRVTGICEVCERTLSKLQPIKNAPAIADMFDVQQWHDGHLIERMYPNLNCHLSKEERT